MTSKRSNEGYFMLDNRNSPMLPDEVMIAGGLPPGSGRGMFEAPSYTCTHCQRVVVMNPNRSRERAWCRKCDAYVCDDCGAAYAASGGACVPFAALIDQAAEAEAKGLDLPIEIRRFLNG